MPSRLPIDDAELISLYYSSKMSSPQIARKMNITASTVAYRLKRAGLDLRNPTVACRMAHYARKRKWDKDDLYRLYWGENKSCQEIANLYGTCHQVISGVMRELGIPRRSLSMAHRIKPKKGRYITTQGYVAIIKEDGNLVLEHRITAESNLGRKLEPFEICHHINGIKTDNRPINIQVLNRTEHASLHDERRDKDGKFC